MNVDTALDLTRNAVWLTLQMGAPVMVVAMLFGLVISIGQAATQIQDQTVSFVVKIVAMLVAVLYFLPWGVSRMIDYTTELIQNIPSAL